MRTHFRLDHVLVGAAELERACAEVAGLTGVQPVYGGRHPVGTHNALLALGETCYLELIAAQPGHRPVAFGVDFSRLGPPSPVAWAVAVTELAAARAVLEEAGFALTPPQAGSRVTPEGAELAWQTFAIAGSSSPMPFFIAWSRENPHPATTSPRGCTLARLTLGGPETARLALLRAILGIDFAVVPGAAALTIELHGPAGPVVLPPGSATLGATSET